MKNRNSTQYKISTLIQITDKEPEIKKKITELLQLSSFERRSMLNVWLEQLRQRNAPQKLTQILLYLFDDIVAEQVLNLIYNSHK